MDTIAINNKKYVVMPTKEYEQLVEKAALKTPSARKLSLKEGKKLAYNLIEKWAKEKL